MKLGPGERARRARRNSRSRTAAPSREDTGVAPEKNQSRDTGRPTHDATPETSWLPKPSAAYFRAREARATPAPADSLQLLRVSDICRLLRISKPTFWRLRRLNDFPAATDVTEHVSAWRRSDVEAWLETRRPLRDSEDRTSPQNAPNAKQPQVRVVGLIAPAPHNKPRGAGPKVSDSQLALPLTPSEQTNTRS